MSNLIPEKRLDKNGRLVTKHVRAIPASSRALPLPAPGVKMEPQRPALKLTPRQKKQQPMWLSFDYQEMDPELTDRLQKNGDYYGSSVLVQHSFEASEAEFYDVHSVASLGDTSLLMRHGVRSKEDALELLDSLHLERLVQDNSEVMGNLLEHRISFKAYTEFRQKRQLVPGTHPKRYADAAALHSIKGYKRVITLDGRYPYDDLLEGRYSLEDIETIGPERLRSESGAILSALEISSRIEGGYSVDDLVKYIDTSGTEVSYGVAMELLKAFGMKFVNQMESLWKTDRVSEVVGNRSIKEQREILTYNSTMDSLASWTEHLFTPLQVVELFDAGIPPEDAVHRRSSGMNVDQIIRTHKDGIGINVASGWL